MDQKKQVEINSIESNNESIMKTNNIQKKKLVNITRICAFDFLGQCNRINCPYIHKNGKTRITCFYKNNCKYINCKHLH